MAEPGVPMRLKEWLIAQIDSGRYPGLRWENRHRTLFRIPWKHAAKQDYRQQQDAALFKAWAVYKGKYHEGTDKADPSTWKTRLRCALNKSTDFQEVPERSQLDISEPYKVYQIVSDGARDTEKDGDTRSPAGEDRRGSAAGGPEEEESQKGTMEMGHVSRLPLLPAHPAERGYNVRGVFYSWNQTHGHLLPGPPSYLPVEDVNHSDCWLHVRLYYCDVLVKEVTTRTAEGCRITSRAVPADSERLYGPSCMEQIEFPPPRALGGGGRVAGMTDVLERLLPHLERGVLLWVAPEGVFMKRQCQGRVYWNGPLAPHRDWPNKLEREKTYKLLDTQQFLQRKCPLAGPLPGRPPSSWEGGGARPARGCGARVSPDPVSCRAAWVPEPRAAHAAVPDPPVFRGGVPHRRRAPLPEAYHGPCGAGVRAGALPSRPARGPDAAAPAPPALHPRRLQPRHPRPQTALPALRPRRDEASQQDALAAPRPRSGHLPRGRGWGAGCHPRTDLYLFPRSPPGWGLLCAWPLSRLHPRALHRRGLASREPWK
ncbi:interferon regulatory factor 4-like isoform X1 [Tyto alba]|uniref:interferon regulatory factor 4-like isoform X1 n=1 Tax=Tyto alba TaxID=56313 RepID=UPI001C6840BA|nr:interferon regulatory factor 4-like isoform X1 [Tyto alba]